VEWQSVALNVIVKGAAPFRSATALFQPAIYFFRVPETSIQTELLSILPFHAPTIGVVNTILQLTARNNCRRNASQTVVTL
jgi:hypothetical protein